MGASGLKRGQDDWEITFRFAASYNVTGLVSGNIPGVNKRGWEFLWVRDADDEDAEAVIWREFSLPLRGRSFGHLRRSPRINARRNIATGSSQWSDGYRTGKGWRIIARCFPLNYV